jgi:hypothetical protein
LAVALPSLLTGATTNFLPQLTAPGPISDAPARVCLRCPADRIASCAFVLDRRINGETPQ